MRKLIGKLAIYVIAIIAVIVVTVSMYTLCPNEHALVKQFGGVVAEESQPGLYFKIPFIQSVKTINTAERLYDLKESDVITADKKTMVADSYSTWRVSDPLKFYQTLGASSHIAEGRIDVSVYNAMKNVISSTTQEDVISGKDGTLNQNVMEQVDGMDALGITVAEVEMKRLDLPEDNKASVYARMISERKIISTQYTAEGNQQAKEIMNKVDAQVKVMLSEAETEAAKLEAEGHTEYYRILAEAYNGSDEAREFYQFIIGLNSIKESLANGGTIVIDESMPLYKILMNE